MVVWKSVPPDENMMEEILFAVVPLTMVPPGWWGFVFNMGLSREQKYDILVL